LIHAWHLADLTGMFDSIRFSLQSGRDSFADISAASRGTSLFRSQEPMGFASPARLRFDASLEGKADVHG
jgi:hypothetical protein